MLAAVTPFFRLFTGVALSATAGSDSVDFVPLQNSASQRDCAPTVPAPVCRVRRPVDAGALAASLNRGIDVLHDGDELTFVRRSTAKSMAVTGGLQYPMSRVVGTDLWTVTLRARELGRAVVSYSFFSPDEPMAVGTRLDVKHWRGPAAPAPAIKAATVRGVVRVDTLASAILDAPRAVVSYTPPARGNEPIAGVIYMGDGGGVHGLAPYVDTLIARGELPRVMLVGTPSGVARPGDPPGTDVRAMEYLMGFERGDARFLAHERWVMQEVMPWAERTLGAPSRRELRAVWGISNSGAWAITMGLRHPEVLGTVLAFSPGGSHGNMPEGARLTPSVRFLLQGGTLEPAFHRIARDWNDSLRVRGIAATLREPIAGHDWQVWCETLTSAITWAFADDRRRSAH